MPPPEPTPTWTCRRCREDDHDQCKEWPGGEPCLCNRNGHWTPPLLRLDREDEVKQVRRG